MEILTRQLEQLNQEIAELAAKTEAAQARLLAATDPDSKLLLEKIYQNCFDMEARERERRQALEAQLSRVGARTPLLACRLVSLPAFDDKQGSPASTFFVLANPLIADVQLAWQGTICYPHPLSYKSKVAGTSSNGPCMGC